VERSAKLKETIQGRTRSFSRAWLRLIRLQERS